MEPLKVFYLVESIFFLLVGFSMLLWPNWYRRLIPSALRESVPSRPRLTRFAGGAVAILAVVLMGMTLTGLLDG